MVCVKLKLVGVGMVSLGMITLDEDNPFTHSNSNYDFTTVYSMIKYIKQMREELIPYEEIDELEEEDLEDDEPEEEYIPFIGVSLLIDNSYIDYSYDLRTYTLYKNHEEKVEDINILKVYLSELKEMKEQKHIALMKRIPLFTDGVEVVNDLYKLIKKLDDLNLNNEECKDGLIDTVIDLIPMTLRLDELMVYSTRMENMILYLENKIEEDPKPSNPC